jgi:NAD(P)-dependent dehydrogenase (short-subunit alcohol dehydrogenase family)
MRTISGKRALVTGAASGIGRATALALARQGAELFLVDIDGPGLAETAGECLRLGVRPILCPCDLSSKTQIDAAVTRLLRQWGRLDILVNNAGVLYYGPTDNMTPEQWGRVLGVNLLGPIELTTQLLPLLLERPEAHVVNVASIFGLVAIGRATAYQVSKFALVGFSESLRAEYARRGLGVTALCPGFVRTGLFRSATCGHAVPKDPEPPRWISTTPERVAAKAIRAIRRNRPLVVVTPAARLLYYSKRFAPGVLDFINRVGWRRRVRRKKAKLASNSPTVAEIALQARGQTVRAA